MPTLFHYLASLGLFLILVVQCPQLRCMEDEKEIFNLLPLQRIAKILEDRGYAHPGFSILYLVYNDEIRQRTKFSAHEVVATAYYHAQVKGRNLELRDECFTCSMRVLTPQGQREIGDISLGDEVMSWNFTLHKLIPNKVVKILESQSAEVGTLHTTMALTGEIQVTRSHPFYTPELKSYQPLNEIPEATNLQGLVESKNRCKLIFGPRGPYLPMGSAPVRSLHLKDSPQNYFIEGVLVHSKPVLFYQD